MADSSFLPLSGAHVLIIDDYADELRLLVEKLRDCDLRVSIACDGAQGYDRALASIPHLILLDIRMPKMDGFAVIRMLKANSLTTHIPILFLTSSNDNGDRLTGLREGAVDYIVKPCPVDEIVERIRIHLQLSGAAVRNKPDPRPAATAANCGTAHGALVRAAQTHLLNTLANPPRLPDLAALFGVPERRLSYAFHRCLGITVFEFTRRERMRRAQQLLAQTTLSVMAVSEEVGFSSAANFSTAFREHTGSSPSAFRYRLLNKPAPSAGGDSR